MKSMKILIIGKPGTGMSTVSQALAGQLKMHGIQALVTDLDGEATRLFSGPEIVQRFAGLRDQGLIVNIEQVQESRLSARQFTGTGPVTRHHEFKSHVVVTPHDFVDVRNDCVPDTKSIEAMTPLDAFSAGVEVAITAMLDRITKKGV